MFHPRTDSWPTHFQWNEDHLEAITATGRATATLMALNRPLIVAIRREEILRGRHPPE